MDIRTLAAAIAIAKSLPDTAAARAEAAQAAAELAAANAETYGQQIVVADEYSASKTYALGDFVMHDGDAYECTTAILVAEAWNSDHWTEVSVGTETGILIWG